MSAFGGKADISRTFPKRKLTKRAVGPPDIASGPYLQIE
jgi:hypothetical protein